LQVSRRDYSQVVQLTLSESTNTNQNYFVSAWGQLNDAMKVRQFGWEVFPITSGINEKTLQITFFHSNDKTIKDPFELVSKGTTALSKGVYVIDVPFFFILLVRLRSSIDAI
jgi:hypothetical protein